MFCHKCGNKLQEDSAFCNKCGSAVLNSTGDASKHEVMRVNAPITSMQTETGYTHPTPSPATGEKRKPRWKKRVIISVASLLASLIVLPGIATMCEPDYVPSSPAGSKPSSGSSKNTGDDYDYSDDWDEWDNEYLDEGIYDYSFKRPDYFTGVSPMDLLRYPENHSFSYIHFRRLEVVQVLEPKLYLTKGNSGGNIVHIVIEDSSGAGANAVAGDIVTVYGIFFYNETITWDNGRSEQAPRVIADKLIINNMMPDPTEFAIAFVDTLNNYSRSYGYMNEHISDQYVKLICMIGYANNYLVVWTCDFREKLDGVRLYVDGYDVYGTVAKYKGTEISGDPSCLDKLPIQIEPGNYYLVTGYVSYVSNQWINSVSIDIESLEPYN